MNPALLVALLLALSTSAASASTPREQADALVREGAALGEAGLWDGAIARFRDADALFPRAMHDCNIGLAYARSNRPDAGWLYLVRCQARTTEALPRWVDVRRREALAALAAGEYAPVELNVEPRAAEVRIDGMSDDAFAAPLTLWLPFGERRLTVAAPGYVTAEVSLAITTRDPIRQNVVLEAVPPPEPVTVAPPAEPDPAAPEPVAPPVVDQVLPVADRGDDLAGWIVAGSGVLAVGIGAILYGAADATSARGSTLHRGTEFDASLETFERERALSYAFLGVGGVALAVGVVMLALPDDRAPDVLEPRLDVRPVDGGGVLMLRGGW